MRLKPEAQGEEVQGPMWVRPELEQNGAREWRKVGALLRRLNGGCPETGLRKRQFGGEAEARVGPCGCEGPQEDVQEAKQSQAQGSREGLGPG